MISKDKIKYYSSLRVKKNREKEKRFLVEGVRLCEEILKSDYKLENLIYCPEKLSTLRSKKLIQKVQRFNIPTEELALKYLKRLSDTVHSQGVLGLVKMLEFDLNQFLNNNPKMLVALERVNEPGNLGTIIRTAEWFGAHGIILGQNTVDYLNPKVLRASMGSIFHVPIFMTSNLLSTISELRQHGFTVYVGDLKGTSVYTMTDFPDNSVLILGNETAGVSHEIKKLANTILTIPKRGKVESLNVAVAAGIILAQISKHLYQKNDSF